MLPVQQRLLFLFSIGGLQPLFCKPYNSRDKDLWGTFWKSQVQWRKIDINLPCQDKFLKLWHFAQMSYRETAPWTVDSERTKLHDATLNGLHKRTFIQTLAILRPKMCRHVLPWPPLKKQTFKNKHRKSLHWRHLTKQKLPDAKTAMVYLRQSKRFKIWPSCMTDLLMLGAKMCKEYWCEVLSPDNEMECLGK